MSPAKAEVKIYGFRYGIVSDGEWVTDKRGRTRVYARPGSAVAFLKRTGYAWQVLMPSGRTSFVNCEESEDELGPHWWRKQNAFTKMNKHGSYDVWKCRLCNEEKKCYGLSGRPGPGHCKENPIEEGEK